MEIHLGLLPYPKENDETRKFFGSAGFVVKCFLLKKDLIRYLEEAKIEYLNPEQPYINKSSLPILFALTTNESAIVIFSFASSI
jgi:hypothetical protein